MAICYVTPDEALALLGSGIIIRDGEVFFPGRNCPGKEPFGESPECAAICKGARGLHTHCGLPLMCEHQSQEIRIAQKGDRGALGIRPMASLRRV